jgi:hypothetical protein
VESLQKKALVAAHSPGKCIESAFPNEQIWISMGEEKVTGSLRSKLEEFWGWSTAKKFFHKKGIVSSAHFNSVRWLGYKQVISKYPKTFCTFITKQISGWVRLQLQALTLGREHHQQMPAVRMQWQDFKTSN